MILLPRIRLGGYVLTRGAGRGMGSALYLSGDNPASLTFGDHIPHAALDRAVVDSRL